MVRRSPAAWWITRQSRYLAVLNAGRPANLRQGGFTKQCGAVYPFAYDDGLPDGSQPGWLHPVNAGRRASVTFCQPDGCLIAT